MCKPKFKNENESSDVSQCSEICGVYHGFMPIAVESVSVLDYLSWLTSMVIPAVSVVKFNNNEDKNNENNDINIKNSEI